MMARFLALGISLVALTAGCIGGADDLAASGVADDLAADAMALAPATEEIAGEIFLSVATPVRSLNNAGPTGGAFSFTLSPAANVTGFVVEIEWAAASPASEQLSVWVRPAGVGTISVPPSDPAGLVMPAEPTVKVEGASPLRVVLPADTFAEEGDYEVVVRAKAPGVAANQPFTAHVTTFDGLAFDGEYSALGGEHGH